MSASFNSEVDDRFIRSPPHVDNYLSNLAISQRNPKSVLALRQKDQSHSYPNPNPHPHPHLIQFLIGSYAFTLARLVVTFYDGNYNRSPRSSGGRLVLLNAIWAAALTVPSQLDERSWLIAYHPWLISKLSSQSQFPMSRFGLVSGRTSVRYRFGSPFSSKRGVVCGHCLVTLSIISY